MKSLRNQIIFIIAFLAVWQIVYQMGTFPELMFPSPGKILNSLAKGFSQDGLGKMTLYSMSLIAKGLFIGIVLAFIMSGLSIMSKTVYSIYHMIVSLCDLIPGVALLPLAILWMGIGEGTIILIVVHSIIWPMSRSIMDGFRAVPRIYIESGQNMGLNRLSGIVFLYSFRYPYRMGTCMAWSDQCRDDLWNDQFRSWYRMVYFYEANQRRHRRSLRGTAGDHPDRYCSRVWCIPYNRETDT